MAGTVLVVDDTSTNRIILKVKLSTACYDVIQAESGAQAVQLARSEHPDLILLDMALPDCDGLDVCRQLKSHPKTADIPIIIVTSPRQSTVRLEALQAGAEDFLTRPFDDSVLLARLRSLLRARSTAAELAMRESTNQALGFAEAAADHTALAPPARVALIAGKPGVGGHLQKELSRRLPFHFYVTMANRALAFPGTSGVPDAFIIEETLVEPGDGLSLLSELRARPNSRHAAIIIAVPPGSGARAAMALDLGASDLIHLPLDPEEAVLRISTQIARKRQADHLRRQLQHGLEMALIDPLTGLHNRRYGLSHLERIHTRAVEKGQQYALMIADLDHFKEVNDRYGHASGDAVLCEVAARLTRHLRSSDLIARIGGEEFMILMPNTTACEAQQVADRLRRDVRTTPIALDNGITLKQTISIGLALGGVGPDPDPDGTDSGSRLFLEQADQALYNAKEAGRDRLRMATPHARSAA